MKTGKFTVGARLRSFSHALRGFRWLLKEEHNSRIHLAVTLILIPVCILLGLSLIEWASIFICIGLVFALEMINSSIERIADKISPEHDPVIGKIKDLAAGSVLIGAIAAVAVGLVILGPKLLALIGE